MSKHVPCPGRTIDPKIVRAFLDARQNQFVTVEFYAVDGTRKARNGQLRAVSRLVGNERGKRQAEAMKSRGQVWLAKPDGGAASFYLDRVAEIRAGKVVLTPRA